jgi:hypothetical protein
MPITPRAWGRVLDHVGVAPQPAEQLDVLTPVGVHGQVLDGRQHAQAFAVLGEAVRRREEQLDRPVDVGGGGGHPRHQQALGAGPHGLGQLGVEAPHPGEGRQHVGPGAGAQHGPQLVVRSRRHEQVGGLADVASGEGQAGPALHLPPLAGIELLGQRVRPHRMDGVPAVLVAGHERQPGHQRVEVDVLTEHGVDQRLVGAAQRGHGRHDPAVPLGQRGHDLLGQEVVDRRAGAGGAQLGQGRPPAQVHEALQGQAPEVGERSQLFLAEGQVALAQAVEEALGVEPGQRDRRLGPAAEHDVAVGRQALDQPGEHSRTERVPADLVHVVEHEAHRPGREPPQVAGQQRPEVVGVELTRLVHVGQVDVERVRQPGGQAPGVVVARSTAEPAIDPAGVQRVLVERLGQQDGLAEPGARDDHGYLTIPATLKPSQQRAPPDQGWPGREGA